MAVQIQPVITTRYVVYRPLVDLGRRVRRSQFAADIRNGWQRSLTILGAVAIAYGAIVVLRGLYVVAFAFGVTR